MDTDALWTAMEMTFELAQLQPLRFMYQINVSSGGGERRDLAFVLMPHSIIHMSQFRM